MLRKQPLPLYSLFLMLLISACGGAGGGGEDDDFDNGDPRVPDLTLQASATAGLPLQTITLTYSANDNVDGNITGTISCDNGTLTGNQLVLPDVAVITSVTCTFSATDSSGNAASTQLVIEVLPVDITLTPTNSNIETMTPVALEINGPVTFSSEFITGMIDDREINISVTSNRTAVFMVPYGISGPTTLVLPINGLPLHIDFSVEQIEPVTNPEVYIEDTFTSFINTINTDLASANDELGVDALASLEEGLSKIDELTEEELNNVAIFISQLSFSDGIQKNQNKYSSSNSPFDIANIQASSSCSQASSRVIVRGGGLLAGAWVTYAALTSSLVTEGASLLLAPAGIALMYINKKGLWTDIDTMLEDCGRLDSISMYDNSFDADEYFRLSIIAQKSMQDSNMTVSELTENRVYFTDKEARKTELKLHSSHEDSAIGEKISSMITSIKNVLGKMKIVAPDSIQALLNKFPNALEYTLDKDANNFNLMPITASNVSGEARILDTSNIELTFNFDDLLLLPESKRQDFIIRLENPVLESVIEINARLASEGLPTANNANYSVIEGEGVYMQLSGEQADEFQLVTTGEHGLVTLLDPLTGKFGYDAPAKSKGSDTFTFITKNGQGESTPATVTIKVLGNCERNYRQINILAPESDDEVFCTDTNGITTSNSIWVEGEKSADGKNTDISFVQVSTGSSKPQVSELLSAFNQLNHSLIDLKLTPKTSNPEEDLFDILWLSGSTDIDSNGDGFRTSVRFNFREKEMSNGDTDWHKQISFSTSRNENGQAFYGEFSESARITPYSNEEEIAEFNQTLQKARAFVRHHNLPTERDMVYYDEYSADLNKVITSHLDIWPIVP
ncbi:MAG: hypothetical protein HRT52_11200 [Colwellia sp.]|nr:hypothetical protein [Colwellia sp.]